MPNYVKNIVKAEGICRLPLFSEENGKRYFDFNKECCFIQVYI